MEVGPVPGIRAVALVTARAEPRLQPAFVVDAAARSGEESWSSSRQTTERGADDEDADVFEDETEMRQGESVRSRSYGRTIDLVA